MFLLSSCGKDEKIIIEETKILAANNEYENYCDYCCKNQGVGCPNHCDCDAILNPTRGICEGETVARAKASNYDAFINPFHLVKNKLLADSSSVSMDILTIYYGHPGQVTDILLHDSALMLAAYNLMVNLTPYMLDFANDNSNSATLITSELVLQIQAFINQIVSASSPQSPLATDLNFMINKLNLNTLVGLNAVQAWAAIKASY